MLICRDTSSERSSRKSGGGSSATRKSSSGGASGGGDGRATRGARLLRQQEQLLESEADIPVVRPGQAASSTFFSSTRFEELGASPEVVSALAALGITRPSHIQVRSAAARLGGLLWGSEPELDGLPCCSLQR